MRASLRGRPFVASLAGVAAIVLLAAGIAGTRFPHHGSRAADAALHDVGSPTTPPLAHVNPAARADEAKSPLSALAGLDLSHITSDADGLVAPTATGSARLTLDPDLQRAALAIMSAHHLPEAALVMMDASTGRLLVYASHIDQGPTRDLCAEATAPSASVFKIVTAAALLEDAHLVPDTKQCYSGGESRINSIDLIDDPRRDRWCTTLAGAMGRSINTVFARLASEHLAPPQLEAMARRFGYGQDFAFDVPVQPSVLHMPTEPLGFARTAAGFWNTTLSPMQAAEMSAIVARGGDAVRPSVVERVVSTTGVVLWSAPEEPASSRALARETAEQLATMMARTISEGTSWRAFHDPRGAAFLPGIEVAGKTGTLTDSEARRYYTWFTGFAPTHPTATARQVAVAALVVNGPTWQAKANLIAREMLRAYFASLGAVGVTRPGVAAVARHGRH